MFFYQLYEIKHFTFLLYLKGVRAIHSPHTGIVDWAVVTKQYAIDFERLGGQIIYNFKVDSFEESKNNRTLKITSESKVINDLKLK